MPNILEVLQKASTAKKIGFPFVFEYKSHKVTFNFLPMPIEEAAELFSPFIGKNLAELGMEQLKDFVELMQRVAESAVITDWQGLTVSAFEAISGLKLDYPPESAQEEITFSNEEAAQGTVALLCKNPNFAVFAMTALGSATNEMIEQKKT